MKKFTKYLLGFRELFILIKLKKKENLQDHSGNINLLFLANLLFIMLSFMIIIDFIINLNQTSENIFHILILYSLLQYSIILRLIRKRLII